MILACVRSGWRPIAPRRMCPSSISALRAILAWMRSEEHTSELQSLMRISYAVFCLKKKKKIKLPENKKNTQETKIVQRERDTTEQQLPKTNNTNKQAITYKIHTNTNRRARQRYKDTD